MHNPPPSSGENNPHATLARKNARLGRIIFAIVVLMIGLSYAAVPLYDTFCRITGFAGTTQISEALPDTILDRRITIQFNADTHSSIPWVFKPENRSIEVQLGQRGLTAFSAKNKENKPTAGTAIYNVTPLKAGKYFNKIQCFCFDEQILDAGEEVSMPVLFYVDPKMNDDPNMNDVHTITLSYTFFKAESEELDKALESFYNAEN